MEAEKMFYASGMRGISYVDTLDEIGGEKKEKPKRSY